jgi:hypothetical protein
MPVLSTFGAIAARGFGWIGALASGNTGLFAWGQGTYGVLGIGSTADTSSPVQVGALTAWTKVACGIHYTIALKSDGTLWGWGYNSTGSVGTGNTTIYSSPVQIGALTTWSKVYPHHYTTHVIKTDGTLWGWGYGYFGQVGDGTTANYSSPIQIGALTTWASATTGCDGIYKTVAIKTDGTLWAWGWRTEHNGGSAAGGSDSPYSNVVSLPCGGPVSIDLSSPVQIGAATNWATTASGLAHSLAITTSGALYAWGSQQYGQLGVGTLNNNPEYWVPQPDPTQGSIGFCQGPNYAYYENIANDSINGTMAFDSTGTICSTLYVAWNYTGINTTVWGHSSPVQVGALTTWSKIAGGYYHSASIKTDGTLWAWGSNTQGQLGTSTITNYSSPVQIGALTAWANVTCGSYFTIAVKTDGTLWSWGRNSGGSLGLGDVSNRSSPVQVGTKTNWLSTGFCTAPGSTLAIRS